MKRYIIKRLLWSIVILFIVSFLVYALMRCLPTSCLEQVVRQRSQQPESKTFDEWMQQLSATYGMDKGIIPGFASWLSKVARLDFSGSWKYTVPVTQKFAQAVGISFWMSLIVMVLEILVSAPLDIIAATKQYSTTDNMISVIVLAGTSLPTFFIASLLKLIFSINLKWSDLNGLIDRDCDFLSPMRQRWGIAMHLVLPIITFTIASVGAYIHFIRTNTLEVLNSDYIHTARVKGLSGCRVIYHHAFRSTLITLVTLWDTSLPGLFSGVMITEQLFSILSVGYASYRTIMSDDIPLSTFYLIFIEVLTLIDDLLIDVLYAVVGPRVHIE